MDSDNATMNAGSQVAHHEDNHYPAASTADPAASTAAAAADAISTAGDTPNEEEPIEGDILPDEPLLNEIIETPQKSPQPRTFEDPRVNGVVQSVRERGKYGLIQVEDKEDLVMFTSDNVIDSTGLWTGDSVEFSLMMHQSGQFRAKDIVITRKATAKEKGSPSGQDPPHLALSRQSPENPQTFFFYFYFFFFFFFLSLSHSWEIQGTDECR